MLLSLRSLVESASGGINADLTATESPDTLTASAVLLIQAVAELAESPDVLESTATVGTSGITADLSVFELPDTLTSTASIAQVVPETVSGGGGYLHTYTRAEYLEFLRLEEIKRKKKRPKVIKEIVEELEGTVYEEQAKQIVQETVEVRKEPKRVDYLALSKDIERLERLINLYMAYLDDEETMLVLLLH